MSTALPRGHNFVAMVIVDFILNFAGLLLWLNWRSSRFDPLIKRVPATLMGTLRPAGPRKLGRWHLLAFIALLLLLRALVYWWIGREAVWSEKLNLGVTVLYFSSGSHWAGLLRMVSFSFLSFGVMMGIFYIFLLPLSLLAGPLPIHGLVTIPLGRVDGWPRWAKVILPFFATAVLWWLVGWLLDRQGVLTPISMAGRFQQALVLGINSYLLWKFPLGAILLLHLLNSYIYFGKHPFWKYISATAQTILRPMEKIPLRIGRVDFAPLLALAILFFVTELASRGLIALYARLPL
jgi:uncharacterized protein YggT (Ycf19 family)